MEAHPQASASPPSGASVMPHVFNDEKSELKELNNRLEKYILSQREQHARDETTAPAVDRNALTDNMGQPTTTITTTSTRFKGYNVIVTGGCSGIGLSVVTEFLREGASHVAMFDINTEMGQKRVQDFTKQDVQDFTKLDLQNRVSFHKVDVSSKESCVKGVQDVLAFLQKNGRPNPTSIHCLFNNAACFLSRGLDATEEEFDKVMRINVAGYANMAQAVEPVMRATHEQAKKDGRKLLCSIINNSSTSAEKPSKNRWTYCASKGAIRTMTRCMALDMGVTGIRVNSISPSWTWSPEVMKAAADGGREKWDPIWGKFHMLGRCGECVEVARVVLFLCSTDASFITGTDLPVDGGYQQMTAERLGEDSVFAGGSK